MLIPRTVFLVALAGSLLSGCKSQDSAPSAAGEPAARLAESDKPEPGAAQRAGGDATVGGQTKTDSRAQPRKIIRTGSLLIEVDDYDKVRGAIDGLVRGAGGFIASVEAGRQEGVVGSATLTLRLPEGQLDGAVAALARLGTLRRESIRAEDVSESYYDLASRLRNAKRLEERMLELASKTAGVKDLLQVEQEVGRVREGIEVMEGQLRALDDRTSLATLTVELVTRQTYVAIQDIGFTTRIGHAFEGSVRALAAAGQALILFLVAALPWLLPIGAGAWLLLRLARRRF